MAGKTSILFACLTTALFLPMGSAHEDEHTWSYPLGSSEPYHVPDDHSNLMVVADDEAFGQVGLQVCWLSPYGDDVCDPDEDLISDLTCGPIRMSAPWAGGTVQVHHYNVLIWQDLAAVCAATAGTITASSW